MSNLDLEQLNCMVALTYPLLEENDFEKYYIYTNTDGLKYFDEKMKADSSEIYHQVFLEEFLQGLLHNFNKNSTPSFVSYGEILNEETVKSQHKKVVMGFSCDNWETAHIHFNRQQVIDLLIDQKYCEQLNDLSDKDIFSRLRKHIINFFDTYFGKSNVFITLINKEEYQKLSKGSNHNFVFYLEKLDLYNKLQNLPSNSIIKDKNKI